MTKPRRWTFLWIAVLLLAFLPACKGFTEQQKSDAKTVLKRQRDAGEITHAEYEFAVEKIDAQPTKADWAGIGMSVLEIALIVLLGGGAGAGIVRLHRGPPATEAEKQERKAAPLLEAIAKVQEAGTTTTTVNLPKPT